LIQNLIKMHLKLENCVIEILRKIFLQVEVPFIQLNSNNFLHLDNKFTSLLHPKNLIPKLITSFLILTFVFAFG